MPPSMSGSDFTSDHAFDFDQLAVLLAEFCLAFYSWPALSLEIEAPAVRQDSSIRMLGAEAPILHEAFGRYSTDRRDIAYTS